MNCYRYYTNDIYDFYKYLNIDEFKYIECERLDEINKISLPLNKNILNNDYLDIPKFKKYTNVMNKIKSNFRNYGMMSYEEMYLLFMFTVDPNFDAFVIMSVSNKMQKVKAAMEKKIGAFDLNLIKIEKFYINNILEKEKKKVLDKKIDEMIWK